MHNNYVYEYMFKCTSICTHKNFRRKMSLSNSVVNVNTDDLFRIYVDNFLFGFNIGEKNVFMLATLLCMY